MSDEMEQEQPKRGGLPIRFILLPVIGLVLTFSLGGDKYSLLHKIGAGIGGGLIVAIAWRYLLGELLKMLGGFLPH